MSDKYRAYSTSKLGLVITSNRDAFYSGWDAAMQHNGNKPAEEKELTDEQIDYACLSVRHDFWSLPVRVQDYIRFQAMEWAAALEEARGKK
jgi:hypothetical protein